MTGNLKAILAEAQYHLKSLYGGRLARLVLFGSHARGNADPGSDIDILIVLHGHVNPGQEIARTGEVMAALSLKYDTVLSCTFISAERYSSEQSPLLLNVRREGVAI